MSAHETTTLKPIDVKAPRRNWPGLAVFEAVLCVANIGLVAAHAANGTTGWAVFCAINVAWTAALAAAAYQIGQAQ